MAVCVVPEELEPHPRPPIALASNSEVLLRVMFALALRQSVVDIVMPAVFAPVIGVVFPVMTLVAHSLAKACMEPMVAPAEALF